jgi:hypothetical protein
MTCQTCLTLNPPGAPACVRCNTPLAAAEPAAGPVPDPAAGPRPGPAGPQPDPTTGSRQLGPGLAAPAAGAPGSSRERAAAVQPPGYGLAEEPPPEPEPPRADPRLARKVTVAGLVVVASVLVVGGGAVWLTRPRYLDTGSVQQTIADELSARGGGPVTVRCPGDQRRRSGVTFACIATDTTGSHRTVTVALVDDSGRYTWTLGTA